MKTNNSNKTVDRKRLFRRLRRYLRTLVTLSLLTSASLLVLIIFIFRHYFKDRDLVLEYLTRPLIIEFPIRFEITPEVGCEILPLKDIRVTSYTNRVEETDSTPNHTASGRMVYEGSCAVSQDLFRKEIFPGDVVYVAKLKKFFIVEDTMNPRLTRTLDIFVYKSRRANGSFPQRLKSPFTSDVIVIKTTKR